MIAGEQDVLLGESEGEMVGAMAGRRHGLQGPGRAGHGVAVAEPDGGMEAMVGAGVEKIDLAEAERPGAAMRAGAIGRGAGGGGERRGGRRMVHMSVADEDRLDALVGDGRKEARDMAVIVRAGIDDRDAAIADDIAAGAGEGERPGIRRHQAPQPGRDDLDDARRRRGTIESNLVGHGAS